MSGCRAHHLTCGRGRTCSRDTRLVGAGGHHGSGRNGRKGLDADGERYVRAFRMGGPGHTVQAAALLDGAGQFQAALFQPAQADLVLLVERAEAGPVVTGHEQPQKR